MANNLMGRARFSNIERSAEIRAKVNAVHEFGVSYSQLARETGMKPENLTVFASGKKDGTDFVLDKIEKTLIKYKAII